MPIRVAALCGPAASVVFVAGVLPGDLAQPNTFSPAHDDISDLGALTASSPRLYDQLAANLTGLLLVILALDLWNALGPAWAARLGSAGLAFAESAPYSTAFLRLDCQGGVDVNCENVWWHASAHKVESGITAATLLVAPFLLAFAFRRLPDWRRPGCRRCSQRRPSSRRAPSSPRSARTPRFARGISAPS